MWTRRGLLGAAACQAMRGQEKAGLFGDADAYERFMGRWSRLLAPMLVEFAGVPDEGQVLDIGSGTGSLAFAVAERKSGVSVTGIDPAKEFVAYANGRNRFPDRVRFEVGDAQQLRFPDATFSACLSLLVFNFIPDARKALTEARRATKPGGPVSAAVWDYSGGMKMLRVFWDAVVSVDPKSAGLDEKNMRLSRAGELAALWKECGLKDVRERPLEITMRFESFADYWDAFLRAQGPAGVYVRGLEHEQLRALRGEVKRRLAVAAEERPIVLPARAWAVRGIRA